MVNGSEDRRDKDSRAEGNQRSSETHERKLATEVEE